MKNFSLAPYGTECDLPNEEQSRIEKERILKITAEQRALGSKIIAVQALIFVYAL